MSDDSEGHRFASDMIEMHGAIAAANPAGIEPVSARERFLQIQPSS